MHLRSINSSSDCFGKIIQNLDSKEAYGHDDWSPWIIFKLALAAALFLSERQYSHYSQKRLQAKQKSTAQFFTPGYRKKS